MYCQALLETLQCLYRSDNLTDALKERLVAATKTVLGQVKHIMFFFTCMNSGSKRTRSIGSDSISRYFEDSSKF